MKLEKGANRAQGLVRCRDLGMNCPKEIRTQTEEELFKLAAEHAEKDHGSPTFMIPRTIMAMVRASSKMGRFKALDTYRSSRRLPPAQP
jgi:predicted small metal-binding protein